MRVEVGTMVERTGVLGCVPLRMCSHDGGGSGRGEGGRSRRFTGRAMERDGEVAAAAKEWKARWCGWKQVLARAPEAFCGQEKLVRTGGGRAQRVVTCSTTGRVPRGAVDATAHCLSLCWPAAGRGRWQGKAAAVVV